MAVVAVAMSGGVDSSVAAALLKEEGADVVGITLQLWPKGAADQDRHHGCCSLDAVEDARRVAARLGIPYYVIDVQEEFRRRVIDPFLDDYARGLTPNPCISCNDRVKFDLLLRKTEALGAERLATGHYARLRESDGTIRLRRALDASKDQSYVLYGLGQDQLRRLRFPVGEWTKAKIRQKARDLGLVTADKPDSVEICFVSGGDYRELLRRRTQDAAGEIHHIDGALLGRHSGIWNFTIGQRSGLGALPRGISGPLFVCDIDPESRVVTVAPRERMARQEIHLSDLTYAAARESERFTADVQLRSSAEAVPALVSHIGSGAIARFERPVGAVAPGQAAVFYRGDEVIGGGRVARSVLAPALGAA